MASVDSKGAMMVVKYARSVKSVDMINRRHAHKIDENHYRVFGREGIPYKIFVAYNKSGRIVALLCPCFRGLRNLSCFHAGVVYKRLQREGKVK